MEFITKLLAQTIAMGTSLMFATIGEIYTEKSGVLNLGVEGMMIMGALTGFAVSFHTGSLILAIVFAMLVGALLALIHGFLSITMRANQVVSGLSITMFGIGLANFLGKRLGPSSNSYNLVGMNANRFKTLTIPYLSDIPILGSIFNQSLLTYILYLFIPLAWFFMYKTRYGLALRSVGENPRTSAAMGINVNKTRYIYTVFGGLLSGLAGACLSLSYTPSWNEGMTGGKGWIVIALVIFSGWNPLRAVIGTLVFGGISTLQFSLQASGININIPSQFLTMAPYLFTIIVLTIMTIINKNKESTSFSSPKALATPFAIDDK